jgi:hypothetical protein
MSVQTETPQVQPVGTVWKQKREQDGGKQKGAPGGGVVVVRIDARLHGLETDPQPAALEVIPKGPAPFGLDRCEQRKGHVLGEESPHRTPGDEIKRDEARSERAADRPPVPRRRGHARARCACSLDSAEEVDDSAPP